MNRDVLLTTTALLTLGTGAAADVLTLEPSQDNTLYEHPAGALSNGNGSHMFAGVTVSDRLRRAVLQFDVADALPAGSTVNSVTLTLTMNMTIAGAVDFALHPVSVPWGEAGSTAVFGGGGGGGGGAAAMVGDATWLHAFSPSTNWASAGGDFDPVPSATLSIAGIGAYAFASPAMAADVQSWLDAPAGNHGWLVKDVAEDLAAITAKRFVTREAAAAATRPKLEIDFTPPPFTTFCDSLPNATGSEALLTAAGDPGTTLELTSTPVPNTVGQFFYGPMALGGGTSLGDGVRCVGGVLVRMLPFVNAGMMMQPANTATIAVNYTAPYASGLTGTKYFQHWFRSGLATGTGSSSSSGIAITF